MSHDLSARDVERCKFAFSIYDFDGNETMDAYYLGDCIRALNSNPTEAMVEKLGGAKIRKQKAFKIEEFLPIYDQYKKAKDEGVLEDFMEVLALYDKQSNGTMQIDELRHILCAVGEQLTDADVTLVWNECGTEEDEDGYVKYEPFVRKLLAGPFPDEPAA